MNSLLPHQRKEFTRDEIKEQESILGFSCCKNSPAETADNDHIPRSHYGLSLLMYLNDKKFNGAYYRWINYGKAEAAIKQIPCKNCKKECSII